MKARIIGAATQVPRILLATILCAALAIALTSCASMTADRLQRIKIETLGASGATCKISNSKGQWTAEQTPQFVTVMRAFGDLNVKCDKEGFETASINVASSARGEMWGNAAFLTIGIFTAPVDAATGAGFEYPEKITIPMQPKEGSTSALALSVPAGGASASRPSASHFEMGDYETSISRSFVARAGDCLRISSIDGPLVYRRATNQCDSGDRRINSEEAQLVRTNRIAEIQKNSTSTSTSLRPEPTTSASSAAASIDKRYALVIGNGQYRNMGRLRNPVNDARAMAASLRRLSFDVVSLENASHRQMIEAISTFGDRIPRDGVGLFYYAGHAIQSRGNNYLIPVDGVLKSEAELEYLAVNAGLAMAQFERAGGRVNVAILDACRDNPIATVFRSASRGLAVLPTAPSGTLVIYATSPNEVAADGEGSNGLFTSELLLNIETPGLKLEDLFKRVAAGVQSRSNGTQRPWISGTGILGDFYFKPPS